MSYRRPAALVCLSFLVAAMGAGAIDFDQGASASQKDSWQAALGVSKLFRHSLGQISRAPLLRVATKVFIVLDSSAEGDARLRSILEALKKYDFEALRVERSGDNVFVVYGAMPYPNIQKARRQNIPGVKRIDAAVPA